jgi:hypothetical protein
MAARATFTEGRDMRRNLVLKISIVLTIVVGAAAPAHSQSPYAQPAPSAYSAQPQVAGAYAGNYGANPSRMWATGYMSNPSYTAAPMNYAMAPVNPRVGGCPSCGNSAPVSQPVGGGCSSCGGGAGGGDGYGGYDGAGGYGGGGGGGAGSTCGLVQHYPYYPMLHGYYYFHPYHHDHVIAHQGFASSFGLDPRNPYSNDFFKAIYAEYRASQRNYGTMLRDGTPEEVIPTPPAAFYVPMYRYQQAR